MLNLGLKNNSLKNRMLMLAGCAFVGASTLSSPEVSHAQSFGNPIVDAAESGNYGEIIALVGAGNDVNTPGRFGATALHRAAYYGNTEVAEALVKAGAFLNPKDAGGATPLHIAARQGNTEFVQILLKSGADVDSKDSEGYTPLQRAIASDNDTAALALIAFNASTTIANKNGETASTIAVARDNQTVLSAINRRNQPVNIARNNSASDVVAVPVSQVDSANISDPQGLDIDYSKATSDTNNYQNETPQAIKVAKNLAAIPMVPIAALNKGYHNIADSFNGDRAAVPAAEVATINSIESAPVISPVPVSSNIPKSMSYKYASSPVATPSALAPLPVGTYNSEPLLQPIQVTTTVARKIPANEVSEEAIAEIPGSPNAVEVNSPVNLSASPEIVSPALQQAIVPVPEIPQTKEMFVAGEGRVVNLDKGPLGERANGVYIANQNSSAQSFNEISTVSPEVVSQSVAPVAATPIEPAPALDKNLPRSMQYKTNIAPQATTEVKIGETVNAKPLNPVDIQSADSEWQAISSTTVVKEQAPLETPAPTKPVEAIEKNNLAVKTDLVEKKADQLIKEDVNFKKYDDSSSAGLGFASTLNRLNERRNNESGAINPASYAKTKLAPASNSTWGGLTEEDINKMDAEIVGKKPVAKEKPKTVANEFPQESSLHQLDVAPKKSKAKSELGGMTSGIVSPEIEDSVKVAPVKTEVKNEVQKDVGFAKVIETKQNKAAEIEHVQAEEIKAPETTAEITAPSVETPKAEAAPKAEIKPEPSSPAASPMPEIPALGAPVPELPDLDATKAETPVSAEIPALPKAESAKVTAPEQDISKKSENAAVAVPSDSEFEARLKGLDKAVDSKDATKSPDKFEINQAISSSEIEAQESKNAKKSVFDDIKQMTGTASGKADNVFSVVGNFPDNDSAIKHYNNIASKTGIVYPYKVAKSGKDKKVYLQIGPAEDITAAEEICASFAVESKTCTVPTISKEDKALIKDLKTISQKKIYSLIGEFKTEAEAKEFYNKTSTAKAVSHKYNIIKTAASGIYGIQIGPLTNGFEAKTVCDEFKDDTKNCNVAVK